MKDFSILIADDSVFFRSILRNIISEIPHTVTNIAKDGKDALDKTLQLKPDLLILDMEMPEMNGTEVMEKLSKIEHGTKIIVCSSITPDGAEATMKAFELGAQDVIAKPDKNDHGENLKLLTSFLRPVINKMRFVHAYPDRKSKITPRQKTEPPKSSRATSRVKKHDILAIAISTGGPSALMHMIPQIPPTFNGVITIVQHMPEMFIHSLVESLSHKSQIPILVAEEGMILEKAKVYIAPGVKQMGFEHRRGVTKVKITDDPPENYCKPAADYMFRSLSTIPELSVIGLIMTGMGNDGLAGARKLKARGAPIITQDEKSCTIYGMPKAVDSAGLSDASIALEDLAEYFFKYF